MTVKRQYVPFASLDTKLLTQAAGHDLPNLLAVDNPFVSTMISTGQVVPLSGMTGFSPKGYFPAVISEGFSQGKYYSFPVAGANSIALMYNIAMLKAANISPPQTWDQLVTDAKALTTSDHYGIALTCEACRRHHLAVGAVLLEQRGQVHVRQHRVCARSTGTDRVASS